VPERHPAAGGRSYSASDHSIIFLNPPAFDFRNSAFTQGVRERQRAESVKRAFLSPFS
jgi:hypothetical protein